MGSGKAGDPACKGCGCPDDLKIIADQHFELTEDKTVIIGVVETMEYVCHECRRRLEMAIQLHLCDCPRGMEN